MADMRLIVAGAGGRMGRTLVKAIAETKGLALAGAVEGAGLAAASARTPACWPGCRANDIKLTDRRQGAARQRRRHHRFHRAEGEHGALPR